MKRLLFIAITFFCSTIAIAQRDTVSFDVNHLGKNINSTGAEYGGIILDDSLFLYSSIRQLGDQHSWMIDVDQEIMQIYESKINAYGAFTKGKPSSFVANISSAHCGNIALDVSENTIYFTRCHNREDMISEIFETHKEKGIWSKPHKLGGDVNLKGYTSTQPTVGHLDDGRTILYFSSNRPGGIGGLDIWYTILDGNNPTPCVNLGAPINTPDDEKTPFYDDIDGRLYFSTDCEGGLGGFDIYYSSGNRNSWQKPIAMPAPINSKFNDIFFCISYQDHDKGFLSSNREDSYFKYESSCCNDIYSWYAKEVIENPDEDLPNLQSTRIQDGTIARVSARPGMRKAKELLPINLYFHNDEPNPTSHKATTEQTYFQTYNYYMFMKQKYIDEQPPVCHGDIEQFFDDEVHGNCKAFEQFLKYLSDDIKSGRSVSITITGHASTMLNNEYNFNLSKRRISSIINQILTYNNGQMLPNKGIKNNGSLQIKEVPYGSSMAVSAPNASIYSLAAAYERRIEILDYTYADEDTINHSRLILPAQVQELGSYGAGTSADIEVRLPNSVKTISELDFISVGDEHATLTGHSKLIPGKDLIVYIHLDLRNLKREETRYIPLSMRVSGEEITQTIFLEYKVTSLGK